MTRRAHYLARLMVASLATAIFVRAYLLASRLVDREAFDIAQEAAREKGFKDLVQEYAAGDEAK